MRERARIKKKFSIFLIIIILLTNEKTANCGKQKANFQSKDFYTFSHLSVYLKAKLKIKQNFSLEMNFVPPNFVKINSLCVFAICVTIYIHFLM